jgi:hypothetical protein
MQTRTDVGAGIRSRIGSVALGGLFLAIGGCTVGGGGGASPADNEPIIGASAGGETNIISDGWELASVHAGNNLKMLNFAQMQSEVLRATSIVYEGWAENRVVFGAPDFKTTFQEDRTPTATKILTWRKIAFSVCGTMVKKETATPALFSSIAPTAAIAADDPKVTAQVTTIFTKFFLEPPTSSEIEASTKALVDTIAAGAAPAEAWGSLCAGYLSSMRFLAY